jgi:PhnB protein
MATQPIPEGYHTVTPYLAVEDATEAIEYYTKAFGAKERVRMETPDGKVGHAELEIGDSLVMLSDPFPQASTKPPNELGGTSVSVFMYVEDVDAVVKQAVDAGATVTMEVADQFWGIASAPSRIRSATCGRSPRTSRTSRRRRWRSAPRWPWPQ